MNYQDILYSYLEQHVIFDVTYTIDSWARALFTSESIARFRGMLFGSIKSCKNRVTSHRMTV
jgi:hypothetical protein